MCKNSKNKECNSSKAARFLKGTVKLCYEEPGQKCGSLSCMVFLQRSAKKFEHNSI